MIQAKGSVEPRDSPYFGLDYYEEKFGAWFFGREAEGSKIITNLRAARLTLLHAESGVGKSSLLRAGVEWRLRRLAADSLARRGTARSVPVVFSAWKDDPVPELAGAIRAAIGPYLAGRPEPEVPTDRLDAAIGAASDAVNASLLIMLDQFEEYFLYRSGEPTPERFADELARCINRADLRANFLIAIREDAYAGLGDLFKGRIANVYGNYLHVEYLDRASAEKAIREPLDIYNGQPGVSEPVKIQDDLVDAVLDQVRAFDGDGGAAGRVAVANGGGGDRVATPLLQLVMETVWERERAEGSHELRLSTLQDLRGVRMIVDAHLGKALSALGRGERQTALDMFDHLVTPSGGKIAESVPDLAQRTGRSEDQVGGLLEKLDHERIVRPVPAAPGQDPVRYRRYEIFHDVLAPTINRAIATREERRRVRARLRQFAVLALGLVVAAAVVFAVVQGSKASNDKQAAESRQLAAAADVNVARDPELSAMLALQALHVSANSQAAAALRQALPAIQEVRTLRNGPTVFGAVFDPRNPNEVASAGKDGATWIWDVRTGRRLRRLWPKGGFADNGTADAVAFNPAGTQVAVGYGGGLVALFRASNGKELPTRISTGWIVHDVRFIGRTGALAMATSGGVRVWRPGQGLSTLSGTASYRIAVDPHDPQQFAAATGDGTVIWNLHGKVPTHRLLGPGSNDAEYNSLGSEVVTADGDGYVRIYELAGFKKVITLDAGEGTAYSAAFSPGGNLVVSAYGSGATRLWNVATRLPLMPLAGDASSVYTARFSPAGSEIVTASADGTVRVWYARPRELRAAFTSSSNGGTPDLPNPSYSAQYSPGDGAQILTVDSSGFADVFTTGSPPTYFGFIDPGNGVSVDTAQFNRDGTEIVTADSDGTVDVWRPNPSGSGYARVSPPIHVAAPAGYAAFSPDGSRVVIVTNDDTAVVRNLATGRQLTLNPKQGFALKVAVFRPGGHQIFTGDSNGQIQVWNASTGAERVLGRLGPGINDLEFNTTGTRFVTASDSGVVTVWDAGDDRPLLSINACPSPNTASFSPDGHTIVVACGAGGAPVFDAATGQQLTVLGEANVGTTNSAEFSPDGTTIITTWGADDTGGVQIWSAQLATTNLHALERIARQRITRKLTASERQEYLTGVGG